MKQSTNVVEQLLKVAHQLSRMESLPISVADEVQISIREAHTIRLVGDRKQICVTDIATHFGFTKSAASQLVSKLTRNGYLQKLQAAHSNKELQLSLTPLGWQAFRAHEQAHGRDRDRVIAGMMNFSAEDLLTLQLLLETIGDIAAERLAEE